MSARTRAVAASTLALLTLAACAHRPLRLALAPARAGEHITCETDGAIHAFNAVQRGMGGEGPVWRWYTRVSSVLVRGTGREIEVEALPRTYYEASLETGLPLNSSHHIEVEDPSGKKRRVSGLSRGESVHWQTGRAGGRYQVRWIYAGRTRGEPEKVCMTAYVIEKPID